MLDSNLKIPLAKILDLEVNIDVVDIGASPSGGAPPYQSLIDNNCASVVGFEPDQDALDVLNNNKKATTAGVVVVQYFHIFLLVV